MKRGKKILVYQPLFGRGTVVPAEVVETKNGNRIKVRFSLGDPGRVVETWMRRRPAIRFQKTIAKYGGQITYHKRAAAFESPRIPNEFSLLTRFRAIPRVSKR